MEMLGGDMYGLRNALNMTVPLALVKRIVKQELEALNFLHKTCGIVHTSEWGSFLERCRVVPLLTDDVLCAQM
jgi:hypothetical protein